MLNFRGVRFSNIPQMIRIRGDSLGNIDSRHTLRVQLDHHQTGSLDFRHPETHVAKWLQKFGHSKNSHIWHGSIHRGYRRCKPWFWDILSVHLKFQGCQVSRRSPLCICSFLIISSSCKREVYGTTMHKTCSKFISRDFHCLEELILSICFPPPTWMISWTDRSLLAVYW